MKEFVEFLVTNIVKHPEELKVEQTTEDNVVHITICANEEDLGIIIGKSGRTINNIRALTKAKAIKDGVKVYVDVC